MPRSKSKRKKRPNQLNKSNNRKSPNWAINSGVQSAQERGLNAPKSGTVNQSARFHTISNQGTKSTTEWRSGWVPINTSVEFCGRLIPGGFYFGKAPPRHEKVEGLPDTPHLYVDPTLEVAVQYSSPKSQFDSKNIDYRKFVPSDRAKFLDWLASDRIDGAFYKTFMLLYFMGLETRCLLDLGAGNSARHYEVIKLLEELNDYPNLGPIESKIQEIITCIEMECVSEETYNLIEPQRVETKNSVAKVLAGINQLNNRPLQDFHMYSVMGELGVDAINRAIKYCPYVFKTQFIATFNKMSPNGIIASRAETSINREYKSFFGDFVTSASIEHHGVPIPDISKSNLIRSVLKDIWSQFSDQLNQYTHTIEKNVQNWTAKKQIEFLPATKSSIATENIDAIIKDWVNEHINERGFVNLQDLFELNNFQSIPVDDDSLWFQIVFALEQAGFGIAPELPAFLNNYLKNQSQSDQRPVTHLLIFKYESSPEDRTTSSGRYIDELLALVVGSILLDIKKALPAHKTKFLNEQTKNSTNLKAFERQQLMENFKRIQLVPMSNENLKNFVEAKIPFDKNKLRQSIQNFIAQDASIVTERMDLVKEMYETLKLGQSALNADLNL